MAREEMYALLKEKKAETDWNDPQSIHEYNEYARQLRSEYEWNRV
jgi:hypothetical protein